MSFESDPLAVAQHATGLAVEELLGMQLHDHGAASATRDVMLREPLLKRGAA